MDKRRDRRTLPQKHESQVKSTSSPPPSAVGLGLLDEYDREALTADILRGLEERGLPPGAWLMDIGRVRHTLRETDALLRRLEEAIIRSVSRSPLDER